LFQWFYHGWHNVVKRWWLKNLHCRSIPHSDSSDDSTLPIELTYIDDNDSSTLALLLHTVRFVVKIVFFVVIQVVQLEEVETVVVQAVTSVAYRFDLVCIYKLWVNNILFIINF